MVGKEGEEVWFSGERCRLVQVARMALCSHKRIGAGVVEHSSHTLLGDKVTASVS